jgi:hypothetical protein
MGVIVIDRLDALLNLLHGRVRRQMRRREHVQSPSRAAIGSAPAPAPAPAPARRLARAGS